jgi:hypothetical protein
MKRIFLLGGPLALLCAVAAAQDIRVNPTGVNVNSQGATTVFLTFGGLNNYRPAEACWCGSLIPAAPDLGFKCDPATMFGCLPARYDLSQASGNSAYTDIMSIPPSVARRAYQAAVDGEDSRFFYVRRFVSTAGGPDQFVNVTCRLTGGGARVPFALTDVKLAFAVADPVLFVKTGEKVPRIRAEITYNGTGRLKGRWEVVMPGEELPDERDLLTEASLPIEERARQRRYSEVTRFNEFLPPTGKHTLMGPDPARLPNTIEGQYLVLLRVEVADDREGDSDLAAVGAGPGVIHSGAVAGFPMPVLRYVVGGNSGASGTTATTRLALLLPPESAIATAGAPIDLSWSSVQGAVLYRVDIEDSQARQILSAVLPAGARSYRLPPWLKDRAPDGQVRWRVSALDAGGVAVVISDRRNLTIQ